MNQAVLREDREESRLSDPAGRGEGSERAGTPAQGLPRHLPTCASVTHFFLKSSTRSCMFLSSESRQPLSPRMPSR